MVAMATATAAVTTAAAAVAKTTAATAMAMMTMKCYLLKGGRSEVLSEAKYSSFEYFVPTV